MPAKPPSITVIQTFAVAARQVTDAALPDGLAERIAAVVAEVNALRPNVNAADHQPVFVDPARYGMRGHVVGCSCGEKPNKPPQRSSMAFSFYNTHLSRIGVPRGAYNPSPTYTYGPNAGRTMAEVFEAERAAQGH